MPELRVVSVDGRCRPLPDVLDLISGFEREAPHDPYGARRVASLLRDGRSRAALATLRRSTSPTLASIGGIIERHLAAGPDA